MKSLILAIILIFSVQACIPSDNTINIWDCYTVQPGDSLYSIALDKGTSPQLICDYNSNFLNGNCSLIEPGQTLMIPPTCVEQPGFWTCVKLGKEYLNPISSKYNIAFQWLYAYNTEYLQTKYASIGMKIRVPDSQWTRICVPGLTQYCYRVNVQNESLYTIAADVYQNAQSLLSYNQPWTSYVASEDWLLKISRTCQPQNGTYFCYKIITNDTFYALGQTFGVDPYQLYLFNINNPAVINSTTIRTENAELMIPVLTTTGELPSLNNQNQENQENLLRQYLRSSMTFGNEDSQKVEEPCTKEKQEIERLKNIIIELQAKLQSIDPQITQN